MLAASSLDPVGPLCSYGPRLAYTYFSDPAPSSDELNEKKGEGEYWFTVDDQLVYLSFYEDKGPLNAACLYRFCLHVHQLLEDPLLSTKRIMLYSSSEPDKKANAALLIALYAMVVMRWTPADVLHPIATLELQPYRDAGYSRADYHLSLQSVLYGIHRAIERRLLDLSSFDLVSYEKYEKVENGDWNWLTPGFVAFASPVEPGWNAHASTSTSTSTSAAAKSKLSRSFKNVLEEFEKSGVKAVIRLNKKLYNKAHFEERGMEHIEMYFDDGTNPTLDMTREFIDICERVFATGGSVAVHCKAGLGRTGTLIGAWMIYKHGFTASEAIGFMRLMRPGSCVGPQQHYLYENQQTWVRWGAVDAHLAANPPVTTPLPIPSTSTSASTSASVLNPPPSPSRRAKEVARPLTPPNESELADTRSRNATPVASPSVGAVPRTPPPRTPGGGLLVPGQPRKTPGKSKHSVASPEERDREEEEGFGDREELMLVKEDGGEPEGEAIEVEEVEAEVGSSRPKSRIARAATATTNGNSRTVLATTGNRLGSVGVEEQGLRSHKAVRDLGGLAATGGRYELRGGAVAPPTTSGPPASPSRLPTRIPAKRRGAKDAAGVAASGKGMVAVGGGRPARRRKSGEA
ncbi:cell division cycle 14 [Pseudohyphozyma bogoriensis]|nr:cell division cycle 14 [Pseudohyphozyma bogoriensis]